MNFETNTISVDVVEVNASRQLSLSIAEAAGTEASCHMLLNLNAIPLLQEIAAGCEGIRRECQTIMETVQANGIVVICPDGGGCR